MLLLLVFVLVGLSIAAHEYGHFYEMYIRGINAPKFYVGAPVKFLTWKPRFKKYPNTEFFFSPLIIFGAVKPTPEQHAQMEQMPYKDSVAINGGGVIASFLFGLVCLIVSLAISVIQTGTITQPQIMALLVMCSLILVCTYGRYAICQYVFPLLGFLILGYVTYLIAQDPFNTVGSVGTVYKEFKGDVLTSTGHAISIAGLLSISIGAFNLVPLSFLDGGRILSSLLKKWGVSQRVINIVQGVGIALTIILIVIVLITDVLNVFFR